MHRLITLSSRPGFGKTTAALQLLPYADYICPPGSLAPSRMVLGMDVDEMRVWEVHRLGEVPAILDAITGDAEARAGRSGILIDDLSVLASREMEYREFNPDGLPEFAYGADTRAMWGDFNKFVRLLLGQCQRIDEIVCFTAHERPYDKDDPGIRGGPLLPSKKLTEPWCAPMHEVLRFTTWDKLVTDFKGAFEVKHGDRFMTSKARCGVMGTLNPANIAEALRVSGVDVPYHPSMADWMPDVVESIATDLRGPKVKLTNSLLQSYVDDLIKQGVSAPHARWAVSDGYHRFLFRQSYDGGRVI